MAVTYSSRVSGSVNVTAITNKGTFDKSIEGVETIIFDTPFTNLNYIFTANCIESPELAGFVSAGNKTLTSIDVIVYNAVTNQPEAINFVWEAKQ